MSNELEKLGVTVVFNKEATAQEIKDFKADKVILAVGARPVVPNIPGIKKDKVFLAEDILLGKEQVEGRLLIAGGGEVGIETAMYLADAERGKITVVEMAEQIVEKADGTRVVAMKKFLSEREVDILTNCKVLEITDLGVLVEIEGVKEFVYSDAVVLAIGYRPQSKLKDELSDLKDKLVVVGDALECSNALESSIAGFREGYYA